MELQEKRIARVVMSGKLSCWVLACLLLFYSNTSAGTYMFVGESAVNMITHPSGYTGAGGVITVTVGIDPTSANASDMVITVKNIINTVNRLQPTIENLISGANNDIPSGSIDFESVALHELGHSYVALRKGCRVRQITLMCIGGAAQMEQIPRRPRDEFLMAIAGPAVSLLIGAIALPGGLYLIVTTTGVWRYLSSFLFAVGVMNLGWVVFNLLPAFPMDGGRILRAMLTPKLGRLRATSVAARLGKLIAIAFGILGFAYYGYFMLVVIAFFVYAAADNELKLVQLQETARQRGSICSSGF